MAVSPFLKAGPDQDSFETTYEWVIKYMGNFDQMRRGDFAFRPEGRSTRYVWQKSVRCVYNIRIPRVRNTDAMVKARTKEKNRRQVKKRETKAMKRRNRGGENRSKLGLLAGSV